MRVRIPPPVSGGIILSYTCSAECLHCMYACTPLWQGGWMGEKDLELLISELAKTVEPAPGGPERISVNHGIHFTGGEPFANFGLLCRAAELSSGCGVPSTFVETNCFSSRTISKGFCGSPGNAGMRSFGTVMFRSATSASTSGGTSFRRASSLS